MCFRSIVYSIILSVCLISEWCGIHRPDPAHLAVFGESGREAVVGLGSPYFQSREGGAGLLNVTTQLEAATYLHCRVNRLGGKTVNSEISLKNMFDIYLLNCEE